MLQTERTILNLLTREDFSDVLKMFEEPDTFLYIKPLQDKTEEEYNAYLELKLKQIHSKTGFYWVARQKSNLEFIGAMNLTPIPATEMIQLGFQLKRAFWNKGFAFELSKKVLDFGINDMGLKTVYGVFEKGNVASQKILEKLEFEFDAVKISGENEVEVYSYRVLK